LKIETQPLDTHEVKITVEFEPEILDAAKKRAARKLGSKTRIPGFRPGKAPYHVIANAVGEGAILEEALEIVVDEKYGQVVEEAGITPYGPGRLENLVNTDPLILEFVVPLEAEVTLGNYAEIRQDYSPREVEESEVDNVLEDLLDRQAVVEPVNRPAEEGDIVYVRLSAERVNPEEGQNPVLIQERSVPIALEERGPDRPERQWPYPGFAEELYGLQAGDEKTLHHIYAEDAGYEALGGVEANFKVVVEEVKAKIRPQLDDEFAKSVGPFEDLEALRKAVRESLEQQAKETYDNEYNEEVLKEAVSGSEFKYPPQMLEDEIDSFIHNLEHRLEQQNLDMDLYLKTRGIDHDQLREELRESAEERMKRSLFLYKLADAEKIQVSPQELENETRATMSYLAQSMSKQEARRLNDQRVFNNILTNIMADLVAKRALRRMHSIASGQPEPQEEEQPEFILDNMDLPGLSGESSEDEPIEDVQEDESTEEVTDEELIKDMQNQESAGAVEDEAPDAELKVEPESKEGDTPAA
jgi:trigger factor